MPLGGMRISAQQKRAGRALFPRLVAVFLDVPLTLNKPLLYLWALPLGPLVWTPGFWQAATGPAFESKGKRRMQGASKCLREVLRHTSGLITRGISWQLLSLC